MSVDISGFGSIVTIVASLTYPFGIGISQFADDADPFDVPSIDIADSGMGLNGDALYWSKAVLTKVTVNVIPGSIDDTLLSVLLQNNKVQKGKISTKDSINMTGVFPDGTFVNLTSGRIMGGMPVKSIASAGRLKSKNYIFAFEGEVNS